MPLATQKTGGKPDLLFTCTSLARELYHFGVPRLSTILTILGSGLEKRNILSRVVQL